MNPVIVVVGDVADVIVVTTGFEPDSLQVPVPAAAMVTVEFRQVF